MENKKPTNAQLQRRINRAIIHVDRTKDTKEIYFSDRGLRLTTTEDTAIVATGFHQHVFSSFTLNGVSRPYIYTQRLIEIATDNDCKTQDGYSFTKLLETLHAKEDQSEYNIVVYVNWWLFNCFQPLYSIGETDAESYLVYESYIHNIARQAILLGEKTKDITNKQFTESIINNMREYMENIEERVIFPKKTDAELMHENVEAIMEQTQQEAINKQTNESKD